MIDLLPDPLLTQASKAALHGLPAMQGMAAASTN